MMALRRGIQGKVRLLEALTGLEPVVEVLQTSALPLGYSAAPSARVFAVPRGGLGRSFLASGRNVSTPLQNCKPIIRVARHASDFQQQGQWEVLQHFCQGNFGGSCADDLASQDILIGSRAGQGQGAVAPHFPAGPGCFFFRQGEGQARGNSDDRLPLPLP